MKGMYAGDNATMDSGIIEVGDNLELNVINAGTGWTYGIDSYDGATISVGDGAEVICYRRKGYQRSRGWF